MPCLGFTSLKIAAGRMLCLTALLCTPALLAQSSTVAPRITANVDETRLTALKGNVPQSARAEYDQGEAAASTELTHVRLVLARSAEQQAALDEYLAELQQKSSPNYHKWLTPEQFGKLYGPADSDIATLTAWLESHGLTVETVSKGRTTIAFSGTVSQLEETFHTAIHSYQNGDRQFYSNTTDPQIPEAFTPVVKGVAHLNTIRPRPQAVQGSAGRYNAETGRMEALNAITPSLTTTSGGDTLWVTPADAATIYDTPNSFNASYSGTSYTGTGVIIGIGGDATISTSIVGNYRSTFLGSSTVPTLYYCTTSSSCSSTPGTGYSSSDAGEAYIDTELSGGLAPGATIYYYASKDLSTGVEAALDANFVDIFSLSFGGCESEQGASANAEIDDWWEQAASQGIAVTVSTGDSGSAGCDDDNTETSAKYGLAVNGLASTPYNIAVGGTDYYLLLNSFSTYVSTSLGSSSTYYRTAKSYIPESTWNDSTYPNTTINENVPLVSAGEATKNNIVAGSGGKSSCATGSGSSCAGYSKPSWQTGTGVPSDGVRDLPDVSLLAANGFYGALWLVCDNSDTCSSISSSGGFDGYGGTSTAAPAFAGMLALVVQKNGGHTSGRLGQAAKELYQLYNSYGSTIFHDVTVGNISVPCTSGTANCGLNGYDGEYYFLSGYNTTTGYDLATGLGSVDVKQLVNYWSSSTGTATASVSVTASPTSINSNQAVTVYGSVTGSDGTATGSVTLSGGGYTSASQTLSSGSYSFTIPANTFTSTETVTLTVSYGGDSNYATATGQTSLPVTYVALPTPTVTVAPSPSSIDSSQTVSVPVTVSGSSSSETYPSGTVTLSGGGYSSASETLSSGYYTFSIPAYTFNASETVTLTATYSGDDDYKSNTGSNTVTVTPSTYSLSATPPTSISPGGTAVSTITVTSSTLYTGTITLTCALTSPTSVTDPPSCSGGSSTIVMSAGTANTTATVSVYTTAATSELIRPKLFGKGWAGGAALALLLFFGIPARRRGWRQMLGVLVVLTALGSLNGCGSNISSSGNSGTTADTYTFTVTGTGNDTAATKATKTFTVTVN